MPGNMAKPICSTCLLLPRRGTAHHLPLRVRPRARSQGVSSADAHRPSVPFGDGRLCGDDGTPRPSSPPLSLATRTAAPSATIEETVFRVHRTTCDKPLQRAVDRNPQQRRNDDGGRQRHPAAMAGRTKLDHARPVKAPLDTFLERARKRHDATATSSTCCSTHTDAAFRSTASSSTTKTPSSSPAPIRSTGPSPQASARKSASQPARPG